jgi:hypothetical protein
MEHPEHCNVASMRNAKLVKRAREHGNFSNVPMSEDDDPHLFATALESHPPGQENYVKAMEQNHMDPSTRKFEQGGNYSGRTNRDGARGDSDRGDGKPKELCPCCLRRRGHNIEKGSVCWMGAQVENVIEHNKANPAQAKKNNRENFKTTLNPAVIAKLQAKCPENFRNIEPDSIDMLEAAVELFKLFHMHDTTNEEGEM